MSVHDKSEAGAACIDVRYLSWRFPVRTESVSLLLPALFIAHELMTMAENIVLRPGFLAAVSQWTYTTLSSLIMGYQHGRFRGVVFGKSV